LLHLSGLKLKGKKAAAKLRALRVQYVTYEADEQYALLRSESTGRLWHNK
jgi:hypothetical protein